MNLPIYQSIALSLHFCRKHISYSLILSWNSKEPDNATKAAKARGTHLRIHFKHCREIGEAIKGRTLSNAKSYLENVLQFKEAIPFTKYTGGIGRHSVAKKYKAVGDKVSWPLKATRTFIDLLRNVESNAEVSSISNILWGR